MKIGRREFIMSLACAAAVPTTAARARQVRKRRVIGYLSASARAPHEHFMAAFRKGLSQMEFIEGSNVAIEYRFADRDNSQLPALAADLLNRGVEAIMASTFPAAQAAKKATATIPVVFRAGGDVMNLVGSWEHPDGNVTGVTDNGFDLWLERLGLLHDLLPKATNIAVFLQAGSNDVTGVNHAATAIGLSVEFKTPTSEDAIDKAFADVAQKHFDAVAVGQTLLFEDLRVRMVRLARHYRLPAFFAERSFCQDGGLASYGSDYEDQERLAGIYVGRILNGEKPADMRVLLTTKTGFVINRRTARTLGIRVPRALLMLADEVIG
jgi:putative tryptophan/tyrosine transport system substrate-binding protein